MGRKANASADGTDLGPPPKKVRDYPEEEDNIGPGKTYKDRAEFLADVEVWNVTKGILGLPPFLRK